MMDGLIRIVEWYAYGVLVALVLSIIFVKLNYFLPAGRYTDYIKTMVFSWLSVLLLLFGALVIWYTKRRNKCNKF